MSTRALEVYQRKRDFRVSPEPKGKLAARRRAGRFVIQEHHARRLHYDFRLEWDGVLHSWAVPKEPSLDPSVKRMAVQVEDHPLSYGDFEGVIPAGQYGAGTVSIWDRGRWKPEGDARLGFREGKLKFTLEGEKLKGGFALVRMRPREGERQPSWLLIKEKDVHAQAGQAPRAARERPAPRPRAGTARTPRRRGLPQFFEPQLATLVSTPPPGSEWLYELKLDGYRLLTRVDGKAVRCYTRSGQDWSERLPAIVAAVRALQLPSCWLDGELVALDEQGVPHFQLLQNAFERHGAADMRYIVFDLPFHDGQDLRGLGLGKRRERLQELLGDKPRGAVQFSATLEGDPRRLLAGARAAGFEGLIGKRVDAPYRSGRSRDWIKLKTGLRQEFVIGGFTEPQGSRAGLGSLLLGVHDGPARVGTGRLAVPHWTRPQLVAEVAFAGWTAGGNVRQAVFHGLRDDKPARQIVREAAPKTPPAPARHPTAASPVRGLRITHPERVIDKDSGITKGELVAYYAAVAPLLLPQLAHRPVALLRAPDGVAGGKFFQKHAEARTLPQLDRLPPSLDPGHAPLLTISSKAALLSAAQMNVVELHTWNATTEAIERPDRIVFDLDPGKGVEWRQIKEAAQLLHATLEELELRSFLKSSGGKGLHVVVPLRPDLAWEPVKAFAKQLVEHMAEVVPQRFVAKSGPRNRIGRVFVDYLRNGRGATTAAAWSARARPSLGISVPLEWDELAELDALPAWTVANHADRLAVGNAPWKNYERSRQGLKAAIRRLAAIQPKPAMRR
jgi:bifunctional non-homologous end joining protein LigD